jgi:curli biogenesis system outer membrane secretion channel CsgG
MLKFYMAFSIMLSTFAFQDISAQSAFAQTSNESQATLKRKVAIARFSNETQSGTSFLVDDSGDRLGKQASDILSSKLAATGKFMMFERSDKDEIDSEQILAGLKKAGVAVDYLII